MITHTRQILSIRKRPPGDHYVLRKTPSVGVISTLVSVPRFEAGQISTRVRSRRLLTVLPLCVLIMLLLLLLAVALIVTCRLLHCCERKVAIRKGNYFDVKSKTERRSVLEYLSSHHFVGCCCYWCRSNDFNWCIKLPFKYLLFTTTFEILTTGLSCTRLIATGRV